MLNMSIHQLQTYINNLSDKIGSKDTLQTYVDDLFDKVDNKGMLHLNNADTTELMNILVRLPEVINLVGVLDQRLKDSNKRLQVLERFLDDYPVQHSDDKEV